MSCNEARDLYSRAVDGALEGTARRRFQEHLAACAGCRQDLAGFERSTRALRESGVRMVDRRYVAMLVAAVTGAAAGVARRPGSWVRPTTSHAAALLIGAALMLLLPRPRAARPAESMASRSLEQVVEPAEPRAQLLVHPRRDPAAVVLERRAEGLRLSTHGTLDEVVPALIALLDDEDPAVATLVQGRLQEIRASHSDSPGDEPRARRGGWRRWFSAAPASVDEEEPPSSRWASWWERERLALADSSR